MSEEVINIQLLGTSFSIRSDKDPQYVSELVEYIQKKVETLQQNSSGTDSLRTAILATILITDELFQIRRDTPSAAPQESEASREASRLTAEIIDRLEESLREV